MSGTPQPKMTSGLLQAFDMLPVIMHHRVIQGIDALEVFSIQGVLRADTTGGRSAEIGLKQLHHRTDDGEARNIHLLALGFQPANQIFFQQGEQHDTRCFLDFTEHAVELFWLRTSG